ARRTRSGGRRAGVGRRRGRDRPRASRSPTTRRWLRAPARALRASASRSGPGGIDLRWLVLAAVFDEDPVGVERRALAPPALAHDRRAVLEQPGRVAAVHYRDRLLPVGDVELHAFPGLRDRARHHRARDAQAVALLTGAVRNRLRHRAEED